MNPETWVTLERVWAAILNDVREEVALDLKDGPPPDNQQASVLVYAAILLMSATARGLPTMAAQQGAPEKIVRGLEQLRTAVSTALIAMTSDDDDGIPPAFRKAWS